jgi:hypothetical protein
VVPQKRTSLVFKLCRYAQSCISQDYRDLESVNEHIKEAIIERDGHRAQLQKQLELQRHLIAV